MAPQQMWSWYTLKRTWLLATKEFQHSSLKKASKASQLLKNLTSWVCEALKLVN